MLIADSAYCPGLNLEDCKFRECYTDFCVLMKRPKITIEEVGLNKTTFALYAVSLKCEGYKGE